MMNNRLIYGVAGLAFAIAVGTLLYWRQRTPEPPQAVPTSPVAEVAPPPAAASVPAEPAIRHPIDAQGSDAAAGASAPATPERADAAIRSALVELLGQPAVLKFLQVDGFARRVVATVDNLARPHAAPRLWPVNPSAGRFTVEPGAGGGSVIAAANGARYAAFTAFVESVDTARAVALYVRLYPLFQQAYQELGYPRGYFNDRMVDVIDHLLQTPEPAGPLAVVLTEVKGPVQPARPWVRYEFADPALEARSAGQKMLLRLAPQQRQSLKAKLAEIRAQITQAPGMR
ncbi:DUF3014 domain-containing protein [Methylibium sp. Pch-M]|uniref:DUF3014 domain-containing protein n=1 Tax=Methylibium sp. Pch-M TaxID=2082386 RepID=UPI001012DD48|nr:DUF3014 domain-containing protein [Methylibium sp. Pch-M]QAZ41360.1 DUF3014 domain-containing protein [Methylibium sp. Pch-M]